MKITIYRGTNCIGGSCVEVATAKTRLILDVGLPLVDPADQVAATKPSKPRQPHFPSNDPNLLQIPGLFQPGPRVDGILLSHAHADHSGLLGYSDPEIHVYCSQGTSKMLMAGSIFANQASLDRKRERILKSGLIAQIGDMQVTAFSVDHSAFDSMAFLIEADGKRLLYSGDLRFHGRKPGMAKALLAALANKLVDVLVMEGTNVSKVPGDLNWTQTEHELEGTLLKLIHNAAGLVLANFSPMHVDRMVSFYKATRAAGRQFVVDVYGAFVLHLVAGQCRIPKPEAKNGIRVYFNQHFERTWEKRNLEKVRNMFIQNRIELGEMLKDPDQYVMIFRPSMMCHDFLAGLPRETLCVYSYWNGYLVKPEFDDLQKKLALGDGDFVECHTSGHAFAKDLVDFVAALKPKCIVPIHTQAPEKYAELFKTSKVRLFKDREEMEVF